MGILDPIVVLCLCLVNEGPPSLSTKDLDDYEARIRVARKNCGPVALCYCLHRLGRNVSVGQVLEKVIVDDDGVTIKDLLDVSASFGFKAKALRSSGQSLEVLPTPSILIVDSVHCVVFDGMDREKQQIRLFDPAVGHLTLVQAEELGRHWTREAIVFSEPHLTGIGFFSFVVVTMMGTGTSLLAARTVVERFRCRLRIARERSYAARRE